MLDERELRIKPKWWATIFVLFVALWGFMTAGLFAGIFRSFIPVTLTSERSGLVMETGGKVKLRGVQVGRVAEVTRRNDVIETKLEIYPDQARFIPANVGAQIRATTVFGAKYVDLIYPGQPSAQRLAKGTVLNASNVSTEVNTIFGNLVGVLKKIEPAKLNATLTALAEGFRGQGTQIGEAITATDDVLAAINPRMDAVAKDWRSFGAFSNAYGAAAGNIIAVLDAASTTSETFTGQSSELNSLLLGLIGFTRSGIDLLGPNRENFVEAINVIRPTLDLVNAYNPEYTCTLKGAVWFLTHGGYAALGGNGKSAILDAGLMLGDDPYRFPENLPKINAKGGPGGKPGCGSLPDPTKNFPVRYLVTDTGYGTGLDIRPNPGIGFPGWMDLFPVTRAVPEAPVLRNPGPPAPGPLPAYPGAPAYGAPLYGPDGTPLYPPPPGSPVTESAP